MKYTLSIAATRVVRTPRFEKNLDRVPEHIRVKVIAWVGFVEILGIREVRKRPGYHDEPLHGKREGERSVRMSKGYRVIYAALFGDMKILLLEVSKHDY